MFRSTSQFDKLLDKSTSNLLLEPDWTSILQLCDCVRQGDIQAKYAVNAIKKKFYASNPHVVLYALQVMESCVKNCGTPIHQEIATKAFMEELKDLVKTCNNDSVKNKILELIQTWAHAFRNEPNYRAVQDALNMMKVEGYAFPVLKESDAMFLADSAPEWADGECCHRCRVQFSVMQRKHHCRNCGQIFCAKCSSKSSTIPRFGIEKEVRVCEACYEKLNKAAHSGKATETELPPEYLTSSLALQSQAPTKTEQELQEEEEFQLALAISKSEAESKGKEVTPSPARPAVVENNIEMDPELARYMDRNYWEQKHVQDEVKVTATTVPTAPVSSTTSTNTIYSNIKTIEKYQNGVADDLEEFVGALRGNLEIFVNRMKSNSSRGRSISNDTAVQSLFMNITAMHSQLLRFIQEQEDKRVYYEGLQDKLNQIKDARAALDALREDHREKLRREAEEAERLRQIQMAQKLEVMRKKKQEYLEYQRQIALQRMQEQEREMHLRQEQQKQQYMRAIPGGIYMPAVPPQAAFVPPPQPNFSPAGSKDGSPVHTPYSPHQTPYQTTPLYQPTEFPHYNMQGMSNAIPSLPQGTYVPSQMVGPSNHPPQIPPSNIPTGTNLPHPSALPPTTQPVQVPAGTISNVPPNQPPANVPPVIDPSSQPHQSHTSQSSVSEGELISFD